MLLYKQLKYDNATLSESFLVNVFSPSLALDVNERVESRLFELNHDKR